MPLVGGVDDSRFRAVAASVQDALIAADGDSTIVFWSPSAERIFGWPEAEALGQPLTMLMPERLHDAHRAGIGRVAAGGEPRLVGGPPVRITGLRRDGTEFPIELTLGRWSEDGRAFFTGVVRDITERERGEQVLTTQYAVAAALAASQDLEEGFVRALEAIGRGMGWEAGHLWLIEPQSGELSCRAVWHLEREGLEQFARKSQSRRFARGEGLPGSAWETRGVVWLEDLEQADNFPRRRHAARAGLRSGIAVPLVAQDADHGVVEFFSASKTEPHDTVVSALEALGGQLAQFLLRRHAEAQVAERREHQRQARELNDEIVQGLVTASYLLAHGDVDDGTHAVEVTLQAAKAMVRDLLGPEPPEPGDLRRSAAALVNPPSR